jgi:hypothetical protein
MVMLLQTLVPDPVTRLSPTVELLTPCTLAVMTEPAGEPILGVIETKAGERVTLVRVA